jgi:hypothetical protein
MRLEGRLYSQLFFYATLFLANVLFCGWLTALSIVLLMGLLNLLVKKWIWNRFPLFGEDSLESLFFGSILGLGLFPLVWTLFALLTKGPTRLVLTIVGLLILLAVPINAKRPASSPEDRSVRPGQILPLVLMTLLLVYFPFKNLGKETESGFAYRAYFGDFLKHCSIINTITYRSIPPENPYFKGTRLRYYWMSYALPSGLLIINNQVEKSTLGFAVTVNLFLLGALFLLIFSSFKKEKRALVLAYFFTLAPVIFLSFEGVYLIGRRISDFNPWHFLRLTAGYNVDGLTRWWWQTPQIDTLLRTLVYTPQAALSLCFFVLYLVLRHRGKSPPFLPLFLLSASLYCNILVGSAFAVFFGFDLIYFVFEQSRTPGFRALLLSRLGYSAVFLTGCLGLLFALGILQTGGNKFILLHLPLKVVPPYLLLNLGVLLVLGFLGALVTWKKEPYLPALLAIGAIMCTFQIQGFPSDISLKLSLVLTIVLTLAAVELFKVLESRRLAWLGVLLLIACLPAGVTSLIDEFNSSDISNKRFTFYLPKEERALLEWARKSLPLDAVVQDYPPARQFDCSIVPTFMARQTYIGDSINGRLFLIPEAAYKTRLDSLKRVFSELPASESELKIAGITHLFWGLAEQKAFGIIPQLKVVRKLQDTYLFEIR